MDDEWTEVVAKVPGGKAATMLADYKSGMDCRHEVRIKTGGDPDAAANT